VQEAQGQELLAAHAGASLPVVLVCDCNSRADGTGTATYADLLAAGFTDTWSARWRAAPGFTCCQDEDLRNPTTAVDQRIDLVLVRGRAHVRHVTVTGEDEAERTPAGLWPSDHAGVTATIQFKP
jgi:endonuclease/exonuclease/phosphatase family metal-dependent hydrolase